MTKQRFSDIENAVLVGLLEAPEHDEHPFKTDPTIFTTPLKRSISTTVNKYINNGKPHLAMYTFSKAVDELENLQDEWIEIQEKTSTILPVSVLKRYYDDLVVEHKERLFRGEL